MNITNKEKAQDMIKDCVKLARIEGLEGHARAAEARLSQNGSEESPKKKAKN
jgi:histidinol dehydrogenase